MIYDGETTFGFFTESALEQQKGLANADDRRYWPDPNEGAAYRPYALADVPPLFPEPGSGEFPPRQMTMPGRAIRMMDVIERYDPVGGPAGLGYIQGSKIVDPEEWFFRAHFYQDPVWPGSLGIEAFMQLLKFIALERWPRSCFTVPVFTGYRSPARLDLPGPGDSRKSESDRRGNRYPNQ